MTLPTPCLTDCAPLRPRRGRGRGSLSYVPGQQRTTTVDRRPTKLNISGYELDEKTALLAHLAVSPGERPSSYQVVQLGDLAADVFVIQLNLPSCGACVWYVVIEGRSGAYNVAFVWRTRIQLMREYQRGGGVCTSAWCLILQVCYVRGFTADHGSCC